MATLPPAPFKAETVVPEATLATIGRYARVLDMASATTIENQDEANRVASDIRALKTKREELVAQQDSVLAPMRTVAERIKALFTPTLNAIDAADGILRKTLLGWTVAEDTRVRRERAEAEERQRAARQKAEAEAAEIRRAAQAEERRLAEEAAAARRAGDAEAEARAREQARVAAENAEAEATARELEASSAVAVVAGAAKATGTGTRANWKAEVVVDETSAVRDIVAGIIAGDMTLVALLSLNAPAANALAKAQKEHFKVPGLRAVNTPSTIVRKG